MESDQDDYLRRYRAKMQEEETDSYLGLTPAERDKNFGLMLAKCLDLHSARNEDEVGYKLIYHDEAKRTILMCGPSNSVGLLLELEKVGVPYELRKEMPTDEFTSMAIRL